MEVTVDKLIEILQSWKDQGLVPGNARVMIGYRGGMAYVEDYLDEKDVRIDDGDTVILLL